MSKDLLLVKLPRIENMDQDFFGIGYYTDHGFTFVLITEDYINLKPLRFFPFLVYNGYDSSEQFKVIGTIKNLPKITQV